MGSGTNVGNVLCIHYLPIGSSPSSNKTKPITAYFGGRGHPRAEEAKVVQPTLFIAPEATCMHTAAIDKLLNVKKIGLVDYSLTFLEQR